MKLKEASKVIKDGWVRKRKGFRIRFEKREEDRWVEDFFPDKEESAIKSEVAAWEYARRFAQSTRADRPEEKPGATVNVYVVDDLGKAVPFYATNQSMVMNPWTSESTPGKAQGSNGDQPL
jgi:hypothetical protein